MVVALMTQAFEHPLWSQRALRAGTVVAVAALWLAAWFALEGAIYVWLMLLGVYVLSMSVAPFVVGSALDDSKPLHLWLSRFVRIGGWFVLSGFLAMALFVLYAVWRELTGNSLFPQ